MRKFKYISAIIIAILLSTLLFACKKTVTEIWIEPDTLKSVYQLDEQLNLADARLSVGYANGKTESIQILKGMLQTEFDSATTGAKQLVIAYGGQSVVFNYTVVWDTPIDSPFRLLMTNQINTNTVEISTKNIQMVPNGIYAISFKLTLDGVDFVSLSQYAGDSYAMQHLQNGDTISVMVYNHDAKTPLMASGNLLTLVVARKFSASYFKITISGIKITDGTKDFDKIPDCSINL